MSLKDKLKGNFDRFSGKEIAQSVDQFSDVYGEVLLGMHREVEAQKEIVQLASCQIRDEINESTNARVRLAAKEADIRQAITRADTRVSELLRDASAKIQAEIAASETFRKSLHESACKLDQAISRLNEIAIQARSQADEVTSHGNMLADMKVELENPKGALAEVQRSVGKVPSQISLYDLLGNISEEIRRMERRARIFALCTTISIIAIGVVLWMHK